MSTGRFDWEVGERWMGDGWMGRGRREGTVRNEDSGSPVRNGGSLQFSNQPPPVSLPEAWAYYIAHPANYTP